jgi:hypothetical protein
VIRRVRQQRLVWPLLHVKPAKSYLGHWNRRANRQLYSAEKPPRSTFFTSPEGLSFWPAANKIFFYPFVLRHFFVVVRLPQRPSVLPSRNGSGRNIRAADKINRK